MILSFLPSQRGNFCWEEASHSHPLLYQWWGWMPKPSVFFRWDNSNFPEAKAKLQVFLVSSLNCFQMSEEPDDILCPTNPGINEN